MERITDANASVIFASVWLVNQLPSSLRLFFGALFFPVLRRTSAPSGTHWMWSAANTTTQPLREGIPLQALTAALSGTVGGQHRRVAVAVSPGGPGATFDDHRRPVRRAQAPRVHRPKYWPEPGRVIRRPHDTSRRPAEGHRLGKVLAALFAIACICGSF